MQSNTLSTCKGVYNCGLSRCVKRANMSCLSNSGARKDRGMDPDDDPYTGDTVTRVVNGKVVKRERNTAVVSADDLAQRDAPTRQLSSRSTAAASSVRSPRNGSAKKTAPHRNPSQELEAALRRSEDESTASRASARARRRNAAARAREDRY